MIIDEAYIEFQVHDDPAAFDRPGRRSTRTWSLLRTFSKSHSLAGLRVGYAMGSPAFRAAVDAVRQPFSVNALAQAAAVEALEARRDESSAQIENRDPGAGPGRDRLRRDSASTTTDSQANFSWISLGENGRGNRRPVIGDLAEAGIVVRAGRLLGGPGWLRISYGTAEENDRLLAALGDSIQRPFLTPVPAHLIQNSQ